MEDRHDVREDEQEVAEAASRPIAESPEEGPATEVVPAEPMPRFPSSNLGRPRIEGVEAGVAAGLVPSTTPPSGGRVVPGATPRHLAPDETQSMYEEAVPDEIVEGVELPDWTDPPTREVPRVLLEEGVVPPSTVRGPVWRESDRDFDEDSEAFAEMVSGTVAVVSHDVPGEDDDFDRYEVMPAGPAVPAVPVLTSGEQPESTTATVVEPRPRLRFAGRAASPSSASVSSKAATASVGEVPADPSRAGRNPVVATLTGVLVGGVALLCFYAGPAASLVIASVVLLLAAAEFFQTLRRARYQPATLLGLIAAPGFAIAAYFKGLEAVAVLGALAVVGTMFWYLVGVTRRAIVPNISATLLGIGWVAGLGSFAGLLLDPSAFPDSHGVAYLLGALEAVVAYDVGGYLFGTWVGEHKLAPAVSPNKTWEGLVGGSLSALVVAGLITARMHPWTLTHALLLGVAVAILAPIGDLVESMIKRDLSVKDMGHLLPAHGGVLDRVDAILFVLPAAYVLVRLFHG